MSGACVCLRLLDELPSKSLGLVYLNQPITNSYTIPDHNRCAVPQLLNNSK